MATPRTVDRNRDSWNTSPYTRNPKGLIIDGEAEFVSTRRRLAALKSERQPFEADAREIAGLFAPGRVRIGEETASTSTRRRYSTTLNNRPIVAARTMASGLHAGLTSPARPWFRLMTPDRDLAEFGPMRTWLTLLERRVGSVFAKSNLYTALPYCYGEVGLFGTLAMLALESGDDKLMRFEPYTFGQFWIARDEHGKVDTLYKITMVTVRNVVKRFGLENCTQSTQDKYRRNSASALEQKIPVLCAIEPNVDRQDYPGARGMPWQAVYWELNNTKDGDAPLRRAGFHANPILATAWEISPGDVYGSVCPGMIALGPARGLQMSERVKAQAQQRANNPPLQGPSSLVKQGVSVLPGAFNVVDNTANPNARIQSLYDLRPDMQGMLDDIRSDEREINEALFVDLFLMLQQDARSQPPTAEEIRARYEEKVLALGPTLEQFNGTLLGPLIDRTVDAIFRESMPFWTGALDGEPPLPPPPGELQNQPINVDFISALQQAQRAASLTNIERFATFGLTFSQSHPEAGDKIDVDQIIDEYASGLNLPGGCVRSDDAVAAIRKTREQSAQQQRMAAMAPAIKDAGAGLKDMAEATPADGSVLQALSGAMTGMGTMGA